MIHTTLCATVLGLAATALGPLQDDHKPDVERVPVQAVPDPGVASSEVRAVDLAICLDTSGSMDDLLDAARQKLWTIVNDLALAEPSPELRVALLTFGNDGQDPSAGWVKVFSPLTTDLDTISLHLFAQTTNGGTELVGRVVKSAVDQLEWSPDPQALKLIFVAGNESADQDQEVSFRDACKAAIEAGIQVNSIYCGNPADDLAPVWQEVAMRADGHFAAIDQQSGTLVIESPFDAELISLNEALNKTYLPFGEMGHVGCANQILQDANASGLNTEAIASRARSKASKLYFNSWDLVDSLDKEQVKLAEVAIEDLPEAMRAMTPEQRQAHVEAMRKARKEVQGKIAAVSVKRDAFVAREMQRLALDDKDSFDNAVRAAVRSQAEAKGFTFAEPVHVLEAVESAGAEGSEVGVEAEVPAGAGATGGQGGQEIGTQGGAGRPPVSPPAGQQQQRQQGQQTQQQQEQQTEQSGGGQGGGQQGASAGSAQEQGG